MQPSNQLKGLVESYGNVGSTDYHENKKLERTLVNAIGVQMVSEGYTEDDVEEFVSESSDGKLLAKFKEALQNESVTAYITEDGTFDTKLRYVEGAIHARLHEQGGRRVRSLLEMRPGGEQTKTNRQKEIDRKAKGGAKDTGFTAKIGRAIRDFLNPPRSKSADPVVRAGGSYTAPGGGPVLPTKPAKPAPKLDPKPVKPDPKPAAAAPSPKPVVAKPSVVVKPAATTKVGDKKMTDAEIRAAYDKKRYSKDPKVRATAKDFGMKASKAKFGSNKPKTPNPLMQRTFGYQKGNAPDQVAKKAKMKESAELDLVLQHLVSEGIAESSEGALIMLEGMSEEFFTNILEQMQMGAAIVEFLIQNGEAESLEEANYIISEMDEDNIELLINQIEEQSTSKIKATGNQGQTVRMTATGKEPPGDKVLRRVRDFIMGSPTGNKLKSTPKN